MRVRSCAGHWTVDFRNPDVSGLHLNSGHLAFPLCFAHLCLVTFMACHGGTEDETRACCTFPFSPLGAYPRAVVTPFVPQATCLAFQAPAALPWPAQYSCYPYALCINLFSEVGWIKSGRQYRAGEHLCQGITGYGCCCLVLPPHLLTKPHP